VAGSSHLKADFNVYLDGTKLDGATKAAVSGVRVYLTHSGASAFEIVVDDPELRWQDKPTFTECKEVKIELGVPGKMKKVFDGEVTAWRTELERSGPTVLVLRGLDRSHRLMRGHKTKTYAQASPIDCAQQIASAVGLTPKTSAGQPAPVKTFRIQANESDYSFLRKMADLEGYLFYVDGSDLHFERPKVPSNDDVTVTYGEDLETFLPVANFRRPAANVEVGAWDSGGKAALTGKAKPGDELWSVPGGKPGADLAKFQGTKASLGIVESQVATQEHADTVAKAALTRRNLEFLTAEVEVEGNPEIKPGAMVNVKKVGVYSGHYLVTEANHFFDAAGYSCIFYVARDKWGDSSTTQEQRQQQQQQQRAAKKQQAAKSASAKPPKQVAPDEFVAQVIDDQTGEPVPNVELEVSPPNGPPQMLHTDRDGLATLRVAGKGNSTVKSPLHGAALERTLTFVAKGPGGGGGRQQELPPLSGSAIVARVQEYKVKTGDTLVSLASKNGLTERELAMFNWGVWAPTEIDEQLRDKVGCTKKTQQGNYCFDDSDDPGIVYIPKPWTESGLASGQPHILRVRRICGRLPDLKLLYQIDPHAPSAKDDILVLEAEDGSWRHEIHVSTLTEVEPHWVELVFPKPPAGVRFNLLQDPGDGQPTMFVFKGADYGDLQQ
jgi:uncharacterized protein